MVSILETSQDAAGGIPFGRRCDRDECQRQFTAARLELGSFVVAVWELYGPLAAADAANYWIEILQATDLPVVSHSRDWRGVTIQAASRLTRGQQQ